MTRYVSFMFIIVATTTARATSGGGTALTYQGRLLDAGEPATGLFHLKFELWDAAKSGSAIGAPQVLNDVLVSDGLFTVELDFGANSFDNSDRWLAVTVDGIPLSPRQAITRSPYSIQTRGLFVDDNDNIGIGTMQPQSEVHMLGSSPALRLQVDGDPNSSTILDQFQPTIFRIRQFDGAGGGSLIDFNPMPLDGTSDAQIRMFRETNTSGLKQILIHRGNNTSEVSAVIGADGADSFLQLGGGNLGIGTASPKQSLHNTGDYYGRGHVYLHAFQGDGSDGTAYLQARDDSGTSDIAMQLRTQEDGQFCDTMYLAANGNVGIGTAEPFHKLYVFTDGETRAIQGQSTKQDGIGVFGLASNSTGSNTGVFGWTNSRSGYGVYSHGDYGGSGAKYFVQPHPYDPSKEIRFVCLEGNESGTYFRGSTQLIDGRAVIDVPEEFRLVTEADGLTVQVTAKGPSAGLWVEIETLDRIVVRGNGNVAFNYFVNGVRRGFADLELIRGNQGYVPKVRGVPYGTQYREAHRQILVDNGILNPDFTPNERTAAMMGWALRDPDPRELSQAKSNQPGED